jgi:hypothetical protein
MILILYLDDLIFIGNSQRLINEFKEVMKLNIDLTKFGMMRYFFSHNKIGEVRNICISKSTCPGYSSEI